MKFLASLLAGIGSSFASVGSTGCAIWITDEPKCPKSLIK